MLSIRTHAVACFVFGQGHVPVGVEYHGPHPVYIFHDDAHAIVEQTGMPRLSPNMNVQTQVERQTTRRRR
jgi:hypothetical protein